MVSERKVDWQQAVKRPRTANRHMIAALREIGYRRLAEKKESPPNSDIDIHLSPYLEKKKDGG